ncbi:uncharacterized protein AruCF_2513 [Achromobacter ruhlandii]|nr:uncharacterized protein AruCF_2513 [Achromobacter ruhlandii]
MKHSARVYKPSPGDKPSAPPTAWRENPSRPPRGASTSGNSPPTTVPPRSAPPLAHPPRLRASEPRPTPHTAYAWSGRPGGHSRRARQDSPEP